MAAKRKQRSTRVIHEQVWSDRDRWTIKFGELKRVAGRPAGTPNLFQVVAEKIPFAALSEVRRHLLAQGLPIDGVYVAHDSMGVARYVGRGRIFSRLRARLRAQPLELTYFSFYVVANKNHEREIETLLIRAAGPQLYFNERKKRVDIEPGRMKDYEPGTKFYVRQRRRGRSAT